MQPELDDTIEAALQAMRRGYQAVPILNKSKAPYGTAWTHLRWEDEETLRASFTSWREKGAPGVGLILGAPSGGLVDVDIDHPKAWRLREHFLPPSAMQTGRAGNPRSHRWYTVKDGTPMPSTRAYKMPDANKSVSVELRSTGAQTVIPPSVWWDTKNKVRAPEPYRWEGQPWGGDEGPAVVDGRVLSIQVALLALGAVLMDEWPKQGSRHDAYLSLAGGLLRFGEGVHPYWEKNLPILIAAMADASNDDDGPEARVKEVMGSTLNRLRNGGEAKGFPHLATIIGTDHAEMVRRLAKEVESLSGFENPAQVRAAMQETVAVTPTPSDTGAPVTTNQTTYADTALVSTLPPEARNPMEERVSSWAEVDLEPYLTGEIVLPEPTVLLRDDGRGLLYPGLVNSIYGKSESAKSWIAMGACLQEMGKGERVVYVDLEDLPQGTVGRLRLLGAGDDDIKYQFRYVHPEGPIADMQRYKFGDKPTEDGQRSHDSFKHLLDTFDPTLIVVDGMTALYGLHGHDTNEAMGTDVITTWLKRITRGGRTTVLLIDHTGKGGGAGASPIGAHHKIAMVQGTALRADAIVRPMPGERGEINLVVFKDRPGAVREHSTRGTEQVAAKVILDSRVKGMTRLIVEAPDPMAVAVGNTDGQEAQLDALSRSAALQERILDLFGGELDKWLNTTDVVSHLGDVIGDDVRAAWSMLVARGEVVSEGATRWKRYKLNEWSVDRDEEAADDD